MLYPCPERTDLAEIYALNAEFLSRCVRKPCPGSVPGKLALLNDSERASLATVPFLLFSLREDDAMLWDRLFDVDTDLLDEPTEPGWVPVTTAAIAFLWQLARRAPHDVRLFAACSTRWCSRLAGQRLMRVTHRALTAGIRPQARFEGRPDIWDIMIRATRMQNPELIRAVQMMAIQTLLMKSRPIQSGAMAACRIEPASRRVSE